MKVELTAVERAENMIRADHNWEPKLRVRCAACETISRFATQDELAVESWHVYTRRKLCPACYEATLDPKAARLAKIELELESLELKIDELVAERTTLEAKK